MAYMMITALSHFFPLYYPKITLVEDSYIFCAPFPNATNSFNSQFVHLFCALQKKALSFHSDPRFPSWSPTVFFAQALSTINQVIMIRRGCHWSYRDIAVFAEFFLTYLGRESVALTPFDNGHFRA